MTTKAWPYGSNIQLAFERYDRENPQVYRMFKEFALIAKARGRRHLGAKFLMERIRWELTVETRGEDFKINNNYTSRYVRKLTDEHPHLREMFQFRELKS